MWVSCPVECTCDLPKNVWVRVKSSIRVRGGGRRSSCSWGFSKTTTPRDVTWHHNVEADAGDGSGKVYDWVHLRSRRSDLTGLEVTSKRIIMKSVQSHYSEGHLPFLIGPTPQQRSHLPTSLHQQKRRQSVRQWKIVGNRGSLSESPSFITNLPKLLHEFLSTPYSNHTLNVMDIHNMLFEHP